MRLQRHRLRLHQSFRQFATLLAVTLCLVGCVSIESSVSEVYLLRHAEKQAGADPGLTAAGVARANHVAALLAGKNIDLVFSTDYKRTRDTAKPIAARADVSLELYDPRDAKPVIDRIRSTPGVYVIVGHSNTVPDLVTQLGGDAGQPIADSEYHRLYHLVLGSPVTTAVLNSTPAGQ